VTMPERPLIRPPAIKPGDLIGVAAPAGPFEPERFSAGLERLEALGFKLRVPDQIFDRDGYLAGSDQRRAETLIALLTDPEVKAVMAARGGYGSMRLLERLPLETLRKQPKILIGFSDLTALLLGLHRAAGLVTFHGPVVTSLAEADQAAIDHLKRLLTGQRVFPLGLEETRVIVPGRVEGPLLGGNLTLLVHLLATPWLPDLDGAILLIEDVGEALYRLDRMLTALKLSGVLSKCAGIIVGRLENCGPAEEIENLLDRTLADFPGPVLADFPAGHGPGNLALPLGPKAVLDTRTGTLDLVEPYLA